MTDDLPDLNVLLMALLYKLKGVDLYVSDTDLEWARTEGAVTVWRVGELTAMRATERPGAVD